MERGTTFLVLLNIIGVFHDFTQGSSVPATCFTYNANIKEFSYISPDKSKGNNAELCIKECKENKFRFAGLYKSMSCECGDVIKSDPSNNCTFKCNSDPAYLCGGEDAISIYETKSGILGTPQSLNLMDAATRSLHISWDPPMVGVSEILEYSITAMLLETFSENQVPRKLEWKFSSHTQVANLNGLHPGSKYRIKVQAGDNAGLGYDKSIEAWTEVGVPMVPKSPKLISRTTTNLMVELESVNPVDGPITAYQIIVVDETVPVIVQFDQLYDYYKASEDYIPFYISAQIPAEDFETLFTVGDGRTYGRYFNAPLKKDNHYHILLGVTSTLNNKTKSSYSHSDHSQHESSHFDFEDKPSNKVTSPTPRQTSGLVIGLSVAIGLFGFLLVVSLLVYLFLRIYHRKKGRNSGEHQELATHAQLPSQEYDNGFASGAHYVDDDEPSIDHYRQLKERVTIVSPQSLNIVGEIGVGKFGNVKKGIINNKNNQQNTLVHQIADDSLGPSMKTQMLREFSTHVNVGRHDNILSIIGLVEELNMISLVFEYETSTFKSHLLESRALQHYPVYASKNRRFSTLSENIVLEILVGIAKGMSHLSSLNITHGQLCARNVVLIEGFRPKITGFGLTHYHSELEVPDYRRWSSPEKLRSKLSISQIDIWSYGCLMWEAVTLGATPYTDISIGELPTKVIRGVRLPQLQYVGDELYQIMLFCWQSDPMERPSFSEIEEMVNQLLADDVAPHLLFSIYHTFQYEIYAPQFEVSE